MSNNNKKSKLHKREWDNEDKKQKKPVEPEDEEEEENEEDYEDEEEQIEGQDGENIDDDEDDDEEGDESVDEEDFDSEDLIDITKKKDELDEEDDEDDDDDEDEEDDEGENQENDILDVEMEFKDANETMFHSVKGLINGYLDGSAYNSSELADIIVKQYMLGTFIVLDEEEEENQKKIREKAKLERETNCIGFCTLISTKQHSKEPVIQEVLKFAQTKSEKHNNESDHQKFMKILEKNRIGLLINERIINVAPQAVPVLHTQIQEDHKWVKQNHPKEFKENFDFEYLLCITRCAKEVKGNNDPQQGSKKIKRETNDLEEYLYPKFEDFCLLEKAEVSFFFEAALSKSQSGLSRQHMDEIKSKEITYKAIYLVKFSDYIKTIPEMPLHLM